MNADPRELGDRQLLAHLLLGNLPRRGWPGRRRAIALRVLELVAIGAAVVACLWFARLLIVLAWAMQP